MAVEKLTDGELIEAIREKRIENAILKDGSKVRLFVSNGEYICKFNKGSSRYGSYLNTELIAQINYKKVTSEDDITFKMLQKFRKQAEKATFTNDFIRQCLALPKTKEQWEADGKKSPYEYNITTGCRITGDLVSVETIAKKMGWQADSLRSAIRDKKSYRSTRFEYNGYDGSVEFSVDENGDFRGFLSKEYRNCGNGYYYLLINDDYFIGYDVD